VDNERCDAKEGGVVDGRMFGWKRWGVGQGKNWTGPLRSPLFPSNKLFSSFCSATELKPVTYHHGSSWSMANTSLPNLQTRRVEVSPLISQYDTVLWHPHQILYPRIISCQPHKSQCQGPNSRFRHFAQLADTRFVTLHDA